MKGTLHPDYSYMLWGGGVSAVVSLFIFRHLGPAVSRIVSRTYGHLSKAELADWNGRVVSNVHALACMCLSVCSIVSDPGICNDVIWHDSKIVRLACSIVVGYMSADTISMVAWCQLPRSELAGYIIHHVTCIYAFCIVSNYGILCYFAVLRMFAEFSTPSVNQRWFFDVTGYPRNSPVVIVNGFLMLFTFFTCRMVTMPIYWYQIWMLSGTDDAVTLGYIQLIMYIPCLILDTFNIYWFYKIIKGFVKAMKGFISVTNKSS